MNEDFERAVEHANKVAEVWEGAIQSLLVEAWRVGYETAKEEVSSES